MRETEGGGERERGGGREGDGQTEGERESGGERETRKRARGPTKLVIRSHYYALLRLLQRIKF